MRRVVAVIALTALLLAACVPGITTANGVQAFISREAGTERVTGTLLLPAPATNVLFEFHSDDAGPTQFALERLDQGIHTFETMRSTTDHAWCFASGYLNGVTYFLLPCEAR